MNIYLNYLCGKQFMLWPSQQVLLARYILKVGLFDQLERGGFIPGLVFGNNVMYGSRVLWLRYHLLLVA